ncbi:MAG TPA: N-acyl homoserine lactonase family protein [Solirubrobacteraceae bacterium]|jgi:glyoxylase-like metal-dependent hydrolase (beta-lactamase superfamily II)
MTSLHALQTGMVALPPGYVFRGEPGGPLGRGVPADRYERCPIGAFLVEHPERGPVLIDTGMHPDVARHPERNLGRAGALLARGVRMGDEEHVPAQLRARGIDPADVELVVMTHLHPDHTSAMSVLPRARFVVARDEWRAARGRLAVLGGYLGRHLPDESRVQLVDLALHGRPWEGFERTLDLLGDGSLRLVSTPGHTVGHLSVVVATGDGPAFVLGDAVYTLRNLRDDVLPWRTASDGASLETMRRLRAFAERRPGIPLIPTHDPDVWAELLGSSG